jgi:hypothetical protein
VVNTQTIALLVENWRISGSETVQFQCRNGAKMVQKQCTFFGYIRMNTGFFRFHD